MIKLERYYRGETNGFDAILRDGTLVTRSPARNEPIFPGDVLLYDSSHDLISSKFVISIEVDDGEDSIFGAYVTFVSFQWLLAGCP